MRRIALVLLVGCSQPAKQSPMPTLVDKPAGGAPAPSQRLYPLCPYGLLEAFAWSREVFPSCPPPPFFDVPVTCEGGCPTPCQITHVDESGQTSQLIHEATYDDRGRMTLWRITPDHATTMTYDGDRLVKYEQTNGQTFTFRYDDRGKLVEKIGSLEGVTAQYAYDDRGNVVAIRDRGLGRSALEYDTEGRLAFVEIDNGGRLEYGYDTEGRLVSSKRYGKPDREYTYDASGLLVKLVSKEFRETFVLAYDDKRRPLVIEQTRFHTVDEKDVQRKWQYHYDCK